jgi:palmitoyl-protein thioesterase
VYVRSVMVGDSAAADTMHGFFGSVNQQVDEVCATLAADKQLAGGFNAVGFSQAGSRSPLTLTLLPFCRKRRGSYI